jgi:chromosome segregation protein
LGSSARLDHHDPENVTTSGVDILAHPPGKMPQNLSLISGGERSLTAVALLFALLRANPVPFCFFDEVDAALDEANVGRFRDLLREHSQMTQFIVITHNRNTIEAATTIYGVSMSEQGVSQCVSLRLDADAQELSLLGVAKDEGDQASGRFGLRRFAASAEIASKSGRSGRLGSSSSE